MLIRSFKGILLLLTLANGFMMTVSRPQWLEYAASAVALPNCRGRAGGEDRLQRWSHHRACRPRLLHGYSRPGCGGCSHGNGKTPSPLALFVTFTSNRRAFNRTLTVERRGVYVYVYVYVYATGRRARCVLQHRCLVNSVLPANC